ncbi:C40 family peptidase [Actinacidiphila alni]|uniref:C40 family peptidase n=1 Tax=Actinacidiphila alni TaxID=380248 RepID=UPI00345500F3
MSPNQLRTSASDPHTAPQADSHIRRRRHAAPGRPNWVRRAGLVGGVVSAIALGGSAAPALADNTDTTPAHTPAHGIPAVTPADLADSLSTAVSAEDAAAAIDQAAADLSLDAAKDQAVAAAAKEAAATKKKADEKAAAEAKAAKAAQEARERAAAQAAASRSAERTTLSTAATSAPSPSATPSPSSTPSSDSTVTSTATGSAGKLISFLKSQIGKPYVYGATGPDSYDCSGLTQVAYATVGVDLPRTSQEQSNVGTPVSVSDVQPGDLIFWGGQGSAYHVGVYIGDGQYLDAANPSTPVAIHPMSDYIPDWAVRVL